MVEGVATDSPRRGSWKGVEFMQPSDTRPRGLLSPSPREARDNSRSLVTADRSQEGEWLRSNTYGETVGARIPQCPESTHMLYIKPAC